jgi:Dehydrogenase E1 component
MQDQRDGKAGGVTGWVAERAGEWDLTGQDEVSLQRQKFFWNVLVDYWFRMEIDGWENVTEPPALLIGIHSGAPFVWDAWTVGLQWWRRFGPERTLHGTAHDALMAIPGIGRYFRSMGVLPAAPDAIATALAEGHDVALWPGGEVDSLEVKTYRYRGHSMSDPAKYRTREEVQLMRTQHDCIESARHKLEALGMEEKAFKAVDDEIKGIVQDAADFAQSSPEPEAPELYTDVMLEA